MAMTSSLGRHAESDDDDDRNVKVEPEVEFQYGGHLFSDR